MPQPTIVFVPGAWHSSDGFDKVITILSAKGFTSRKVYLPSVGRSPPVSSIAPDVETVRSAALAEMQQGNDVTIVCHSYGGMPTNDALKGLDKPQTPGGGRVSAIVYIAALLVAEGVTVDGTIESHGGSAIGDYFELLDDGNLACKKESNPAELFYHDLSVEEGKYWVSQLQTQAAVTFENTTDYAAWKDIPSWYLIAKQDKPLKPEAQRAMVKAAREYLDQAGGPGTGEQRLKSEEIDASHSPFLSRPEETASFIESAAMAG